MCCILDDIEAQYLKHFLILLSVVIYCSLKSLAKLQYLCIRLRHGADVLKILKHISHRHPHRMAARDHCLG